MNKTFPLAAAVLTLAVSSAARGDDHTCVVYGYGQKTCAMWQEAAAQPQSRAIYQSWLWGFVSGAAWQVSESKKFPHANLDDLTASVDRYCAANPLNDVSLAAAMLVLDLEDRATPKKKPHGSK